MDRKWGCDADCCVLQKAFSGRGNCTGSRGEPAHADAATATVEVVEVRAEAVGVFATTLRAVAPRETRKEPLLHTHPTPCRIEVAPSLQLRSDRQQSVSALCRTPWPTGDAKHICPTVQSMLTDFKRVHTLISRREQRSDVLQLPIDGNAMPATTAVEAPGTCKITDHISAEYKCAITLNTRCPMRSGLGNMLQRSRVTLPSSSPSSISARKPKRAAQRPQVAASKIT
jgi:hypothetical protein